MDDMEKLALKFPAVLKKRIQSGEFIFPRETEFEYEKAVVYRGINRTDCDFERCIDRSDFRSYAELGKKGSRGNPIDESNPKYYGISLYNNVQSLENALHLPRTKWKIARGDMYCQGGPRLAEDDDGHITWWLYENVEVTSFCIVGGDDNE